MKKRDWLGTVKKSASKTKQWTIYLLLLSNGAYYTGITTDINKRVMDHYTKRGSKYVRSHLPFQLAFTGFAGNNRSEAQKMEAKIKRLSHKDKEDLHFHWTLLKALANGKYEDSI